MEKSPFEKRVKRRITGRNHSFFAVSAPGLEPICYEEIFALPSAVNPGGAAKVKVVAGGVEFQARPDTCMAFNIHLRSPSRILMRIAEFKATSFSMLETRINAVDWDLFLPCNCRLKLRVTCQKSRLYHSEAIAQRCQQIILDQLSGSSGFSAETECVQTLHIRAIQDRFILSLDTSGDLLFKRGIKKHAGKAPLRENIAFSILWRAGFSAKSLLMDPMCGTGSFSIEAAMVKTNTPPGFFRSFAFEHFPGFSRNTFQYLKKQAAKNIRFVSSRDIFASDIDNMAVSVLEDTLARYDFCSSISVSRKDFFDTFPGKVPTHDKRVIILNPPYGKRIGSKGDIARLYQEIGKKLKKDYSGWQTGIVLPSKMLLSHLKLDLNLHPVFHGGLKVYTGVGKICS